MPKNSKRKGKEGELELAKFLRDYGVGARRGQQYEGGTDSPDIVSDLDWHIECKRTEALRLREAVAQAQGECGGKRWFVAHRYSRGEWLAVLPLSQLLQLSGYDKPIEGSGCVGSSEGARAEGSQ
jgi:Holliday junction resolvase